MTTDRKTIIITATTKLAKVLELHPSVLELHPSVLEYIISLDPQQ